MIGGPIHCPVVVAFCVPPRKKGLPFTVASDSGTDTIKAMIEQANYEFEELAARDDLFSPRIANDPRVLYHATSSFVEAEIDSNGFSGGPSLVTREHVVQLVSVYRSINWHGIHRDGYAALATFTLGRSRYPSPHTWFRETSMRSLVYAQRSWAGGEWAMSFRQAFDDLREFLASNGIREAHLQDQIESCKKLVMADALPSRVIGVDVQQLTAALEPLETTVEACRQPLRDYKYGIVYAVRFSEDDIASLSNLHGSGILHLGRVPAEQIVAKAKLYLSERPAPRKPDSTERLLSWNNSRFAQELAAQPMHWEEPADQITYHDLRPQWLGDDITLTVAKEHGSTAIQQMLKSGEIAYNDH